MDAPRTFPCPGCSQEMTKVQEPGTGIVLYECGRCLRLKPKRRMAGYSGKLLISTLATVRARNWPGVIPPAMRPGPLIHSP